MTYVRNYIGSKHTPRIGPEGCTILVKLCQMSEKHHEPDHSHGASGPLELRVFQSPLEEVHFERWSPGQRGTVEVPKDGEEVFVIEGSFSDEMGEHRTCQAQSRMKMLTKLQEEAVAVDYDDPYLQLEFPAASTLPPPCISVIEAGFGYTPDRILYQNLDFGVDCDSRVAIVGPNGAGKSTFLKLLDGSLEPTNGFVRRHAKLQLARSESLEFQNSQKVERGGEAPEPSSRPPRAGRLLARFWAHFVFTFFYALMFGGCDFYMMEMVAEATVGVRDVSVPLHVFAPLALSSSVSIPVVGELMDAYSSRKTWLPSFLLAVAGVLTASVTSGLTSIQSWPTAVLCGAVRGITSGKLGRFTQHHIEMMDPDSDAVTHMRKLGSGGIKEDGTSEVTVEEARKYLGRFGLHGDLALQPVKFLSGGQKSRLAFAELAWSSPHIMLLDEPTNHLDLETIEGLAMALNKFEGGVVLVSHDDRLVSMRRRPQDVPGKVTVFEGSFEEYREMLRSDFINKHLTSGGRIKRKA
eukprot:g32124.t2